MHHAHLRELTHLNPPLPIVSYHPPPQWTDGTAIKGINPFDRIKLKRIPLGREYGDMSIQRIGFGVKNRDLDRKIYHR